MSAADTTEDEKAFYEISEQRRMKVSTYNTLQASILQKKKIKRRSELCLAEVEQLPEATVSYKAVGRMFVSAPLPQIKTDLKSLITKADEDLVKYEPQEKHLEKEIEGLDQTIKELETGMEEAAKRQAK